MKNYHQKAKDMTFLSLLHEWLRRLRVVAYRLHNSVGPIVSELSELGIESVAYYGEMNTKARNELENW